MNGATAKTLLPEPEVFTFERLDEVMKRVIEGCEDAVIVNGNGRIREQAEEAAE